MTIKKKAQSGAQSRIETRKAQILDAAGTVFAEKGFQEATISDVAREAGVSDATIYEYFSSKEELLFSIPVETTQKGNEILEFHLNYVKGAENKLRSLIYHYLWFYQNNPEYASVVMLILKQNRKFIETDGYQTVAQGYRIFLNVLEEGVKSGEFRSDIDPYLVRATILGAIEHQVIRKSLLGKPENLVDYVDPLAEMITRGIRKQSRLREFNIRLTMEPDDGVE